MAKMTLVSENKDFHFIVIGGGIAGVTCTEALSAECPEADILLLTASPLIKAVTNYRKLTKTLEEFDVEERPMFDLHTTCPKVKVIHEAVTALQADQHRVVTATSIYTYERLCICTGGVPKVIVKQNPFVIGIRDTETVKVFQKRLQNARRVLIVGNGGIATELAYEIEGCQVIWAIKDKSITSTFIDEGAAHFFLPHLTADKERKGATVKRTKYRIDDDTTTCTSTTATQLGGALGPDWSADLPLTGLTPDSHSIHVEYQVEIERLLTPEELLSSDLTATTFPLNPHTHTDVRWPVYVVLTNGCIYGCDFIVSATGVVPTIHPFINNNQFDVSEEGGLKVNDKMQTSVEDVFAAGDVCSASWQHTDYWVQMRLWSQARQMGVYAARCMAAALRSTLDTISLDFCFEMFAHVTKFFNYKVILLGKFNAQGLGSDYELLLRVTEGVEYIKVVLQNGHMRGAILIGNTDMEETFENLILNQMDLTPFKDNLLNPNIDIDDFFD